MSYIFVKYLFLDPAASGFINSKTVFVKNAISKNLHDLKINLLVLLSVHLSKIAKLELMHKKRSCSNEE